MKSLHQSDEKQDDNLPISDDKFTAHINNYDSFVDLVTRQIKELGGNADRLIKLNATKIAQLELVVRSRNEGALEAIEAEVKKSEAEAAATLDRGPQTRLPAHLRGLKLGEIKRRALDAGVDERVVEASLAGPNARATLAALLVEAENDNENAEAAAGQPIAQRPGGVTGPKGFLTTGEWVGDPQGNRTYTKGPSAKGGGSAGAVGSKKTQKRKKKQKRKKTHKRKKTQKRRYSRKTSSKK